MLMIRTEQEKVVLAECLSGKVLLLVLVAELLYGC